MSRDNSRDVSSLEVTLRGSQVEIDPIANGTKPFDDVKVMLVKGIDGTGSECLATEFSSSTSYSKGDFCTYNGSLYRANAPHQGVWNASHFDEVTVDSAFMAKGRDYVTAGQMSGTTLGQKATAEGTQTTASGAASHAEGATTIASGQASHAEGSQTQASGLYSHAEGNFAKATHTRSHAEGYETQTGNNHQHVQGKYNVGKATTAFEIGNGSGNGNRSNAFEVDWDGNVVASGDITDGDGNVLAEKADIADISSEKTVNGNPITLTDALPVPVKSLVANVEPIQDLHGYDYPWVGGANINKLPCKLEAQTITKGGYTATTDGDGGYTLIGNSSSQVDIYFDLDKDYVIPDGSTHTLAIQNSVQNNNIGMALYYNGTFVEAAMFSVADRKIHYQGLSQVTFNQIGFRVLGNIATKITMKPYIYYGDPTDNVPFSSYSNICPISGWTESKVTVDGENILDESTKVPNWYINDSGSIQNVGGSAYFSQYIKVKDGAQYTISLDKTGSGSSYSYYFRVHGYNANKEWVEMIYKSSTTISTAGKHTFTVNIPNGISYIRISFGNDIENTMVVESNTTTIDLNGTRYGGYTTVDENGVTKFVGTYGIVNMGSLTWTAQILDRWSSNVISNLPNISSGVLVDGIAEQYKAYTLNAINADETLIGFASYQSKLYVRNGSTENTPLGKVCYKLATPIEVTLSNTNITLLDGYNNVWCDSGDVELTYLANRCYESESKLEQSEVATVENGNTASRAYAVNEFMMWKGGLYKVTQAIASGATITSGTNVTKTTIGAVLTALLNG